MLSVCVVDDNPDHIEILKDTIYDISGSYSVRGFGCGEEFIDYCGSLEGVPDYIFVDLKMPRISGFEVVEYLRKNAKFDKAKVAIVTTSAMLSDEERAYAIPNTDFFTKPVSFEALQEFFGEPS